MDTYRTLTNAEACFQFACLLIGLKEIPGEINNPIIVQMFADIGHKWVQDDETSWCACFVNWVLFMNGLKGSGQLDARSFLDVGRIVKEPKIGDIAVLWRESLQSWKGHVGFFSGYDKRGNMIILGGNQSNEVNFSAYDKRRILDFVRI